VYRPSHFVEDRAEVLHRLIRDHPLATLVTLGSGGLNAEHVPLEIDPDPPPFGTLRGHFARANPVWKSYSAETDVLAVFQGPQAYVTPSWYPTKQESGKVVPTWNYMVVHAHGPMQTIDDPAWLHAFLTKLVDRHESTRPDPWRITDAPDEFIAMQLRAIVGFEIPLARLEGKWKVSQNRLPADRAGVMDGMLGSGCPDAKALAEWMGRESKP
jgi:transcriptional regulator